MPVEEFVAGWISGALGLVLGHPFDTVKVRLQTQNTYQGIVDCMVKTYRHESAYFLAPFDLIKVRLQNQTEPRAQPGSPRPRYWGPVHCAASIFQEEGPRGLFRGAWALTLRDTPTLGIYFLTYEWLCRKYTPEGQNPSSATVLVAGGFAGITSWVAATPLDVIKSRMQMDGLTQRAYRGLLDCVLSSARQEGPGVFFRGLVINSARAFPVNAVTFLSYEYLLHAWG
ncbi:PREDICTED: solute carrier family 25 member 45 isoform X2 [Condylura cristata]|uniref:solute carrier family 25 member 45 isoform X2 n=1 Tax=Condylura cristata TaxID=143302 RepID=UPI0006437101|nr:PREDICTED: solute carrier family 25 member 45 isoform X2 [Condylura cristata]